MCGFDDVFSTTALLYAGPFYPVRVLNEDAIRTAGDIYKNVAGAAEHIQGRSTTKELGIRYLLSSNTLKNPSIANGEGKDVGRF